MTSRKKEMAQNMFTFKTTFCVTCVVWDSLRRNVQTKIISTREELSIFFERIHTYFPPIRNKSLFFWTIMYIFPTYFTKWNFQSHFLCKFLKALAIKVCDVMWVWEISTWRTEHSSYLPKSRHSCNLRCIWLYILLLKCPRIEFFIGYLLQMLKANDFNRDGCRTFIVQFPCWKMKTFLFTWNIS